MPDRDPMTLGRRLFDLIWPTGMWSSMTDKGRMDYVRAATDLYSLGSRDALIPLRKMVDEAGQLFLDGAIVVTIVPPEGPGGS